LLPLGAIAVAALLSAGIAFAADAPRLPDAGDYDVSEQEALAGTTTSEEEAGDAGSLWTRDTLTGDWGGWRKKLADLGIAFEFVYTGDVFGVVSGGVKHGASYLDNWDLTLTIDTEPLLGWEGGSFFVYGLGNGGSGSPSADAGDIQTLDNIDAPKTWRLYEAWFQQQLEGGRLSLLAGLYNLNSEFDVIDTASVFINSSFGIGKDYSQTGTNGPSIFPITSVGLRVKAEPIEQTYVQIAVLDGVAGDPDDLHGTQIQLGKGDGALIAAELGWVVGKDEDSPDAYRKIGLGGWYYTADFEEIEDGDGDGELGKSHGNYGLYLLGEAAVYREPDAPEQGLSVFARVGFANSDFNPIGLYNGGGAVYTGAIPGRDEDQLGFGVAAAWAGSDFEDASAAEGTPVRDAEVALELTYRAQVTPWLSVQPDFQYIIDPGLSTEIENAVALGLRVEVTF
jgi:porin